MTETAESFQELEAENKAQTCIEKPSARRLRLGKQIAMVIGICLSFVNMAVTVGWTNPASSDLNEDGQTIYGSSISLEPTQLDLLGSLIAAGSLPGKWLAGWLTTKIGRKKSLLFTLLPNVLSWCLVATAVNPIMLLVGRFINGIGTGWQGVVSSVYSIELADISIRGSVGVVPTVALDFGFILVVCLGLALTWYEISIAAIVFCVLSTMVLFFIPESPTYLLVTGRDTEAKTVLENLRGPDADIQGELNTLKKMNEGMAKKFGFRDLLKPSPAKSLGIVLTLLFIQNFCGLGVIYANATRMFAETGSSLENNLSTLVVFTFQVIGSTMSCLVMNCLGRRTFLISSLIVNTAVLLIMGTYIHMTTEMDSISHLQVNLTKVRDDNAELMQIFTADYNINSPSEEKSYTWIPLICLIVFVISSSFGIRPIPYMLNMEYFPTAIRPQASTVCQICNGIFAFAALQLYTPLQDLLTAAGFYWFYAAVSAFGIVFSIFCVRETKGAAIG